MYCHDFSRVLLITGNSSSVPRTACERFAPSFVSSSAARAESVRTLTAARRRLPSRTTHLPPSLATINGSCGQNPLPAIDIATSSTAISLQSVLITSSSEVVDCIPYPTNRGFARSNVNSFVLILSMTAGVAIYHLHHCAQQWSKSHRLTDAIRCRN